MVTSASDIVEAVSPICVGCENQEQCDGHLGPLYKCLRSLIKGDPLDVIIGKVETCFCKHCGFPLDPTDLCMYPHDGGWEVLGMKKKQWIYVNCKNCGYAWSFGKLQQPGEYDEVRLNEHYGMVMEGIKRGRYPQIKRMVKRMNEAQAEAHTGCVDPDADWFRCPNCTERFHGCGGTVCPCCEMDCGTLANVVHPHSH